MTKVMFVQVRPAREAGKKLTKTCIFVVAKAAGVISPYRFWAVTEMNNTLNGFLTLLLGCVAVVLFGTASCAWVTDSETLKKAADSRNWPSATAVIRCNKIDLKEEHSKHGTYYTYKCVVQYEYKVNGKRFAGDRLSFATIADHFTQEKQTVDSIAAQYRLGSKHAVRYNPQHPGESVMIPGVDPDNVNLPSFGWLLAGVFCVVMLGGTAFANNGYYADSRSRFSMVSLPGAFLCIFLMAMQPTFVRQMVPPNAVIQSIH